MRHIATHTGERHIPCPYCPYRASRNTHMRGHIQRIHCEKLKDLSAEETLGYINDPAYSESFGLASSTETDTNVSGDIP